MRAIVFSAAARRDRREITSFTIDRFGIDGARRLRDRLEATMASLAESPGIGRRHPELDPPNKSFRYFVVAKTFLIVYEADDDAVRVVRLLHGARSLTEEIDRNPESAG